MMGESIWLRASQKYEAWLRISREQLRWSCQNQPVGYYLQQERNENFLTRGRGLTVGFSPFSCKR
jgi:hypothetical protein